MVKRLYNIRGDQDVELKQANRITGIPASVIVRKAIDMYLSQKLHITREKDNSEKAEYGE